MRRLCLTLSAWTAILATVAYFRPALMNEANLALVAVSWAIAAMMLHMLASAGEKR